MPSNRILLVIVSIVAAGLAAVLLRAKPVDVEVAPVVRGPLSITVDEEGETRVRRRYIVAAPVSGRLERIEQDEGDVVEAGSVVARMRPQALDPRLAAEAEARLEAAESARREAQAREEQVRAELAQATRSAARARRLAGPGTISKQELELAVLDETRLQKELSAAAHAVARSEFDIRAAQAALLASGVGAGVGGDSLVEVATPSRGTVLRVFEESERVVAVGAPLLEIGDPTDMEVVVDVLSKDAVGVRPGARVWIDEWGGETALAARVRLVEPAGFRKISALGVEEQRVNVLIDFDSLPPHLGDSFRVEARIVVWEKDNILKVPASSLFRRQDEWTVFVAADGEARYRRVRLGRLGATEAEVAEGLEAGELVILHPSDLLTDGVAVAYDPESTP